MCEDATQRIEEMGRIFRVRDQYRVLLEVSIQDIFHLRLSFFSHSLLTQDVEGTFTVTFNALLLLELKRKVKEILQENHNESKSERYTKCYDLLFVLLRKRENLETSLEAVHLLSTLSSIHLPFTGKKSANKHRLPFDTFPLKWIHNFMD